MVCAWCLETREGVYGTWERDTSLNYVYTFNATDSVIIGDGGTYALLRHWITMVLSGSVHGLNLTTGLISGIPFMSTESNI